MVHEHGSLLAATRLSFASSWARWRTGTVAWGTKALGGIGERPNCSASSLKLATAKSLNISWKFYFAVLWLQQDSLNGVRYKLSAEVIYERSLQGSFNLDHNNGRITQKNLVFYSCSFISFYDKLICLVWPSGLCVMPPEASPARGRCVPGTAHAAFEPPLRCVRVSSVSCQTQRFVARMTAAFPYPLKVIARRSLHQKPLAVSYCRRFSCPATWRENCFLSLLSSRASSRRAVCCLLTALRLGVENNQAGSLSRWAFFPKLQGAGKRKAVTFGGL